MRDRKKLNIQENYCNRTKEYNSVSNGSYVHAQTCSTTSYINVCVLDEEFLLQHGSEW